MTGEDLDLSGLGVDHVGSVLKLVVNALLVARIDEWTEVKQRDGDE